MKTQFFSLILCILLLASSAYAQDEEWAESENGLEYNCTLLTEVQTALDEGDSESLNDLQNEIFVRNEDGDEWSLASYTGSATLALLGSGEDVTNEVLFAAASSACGTIETTTTTEDDGQGFNVVVDGNVNLRSCAGTDCDVVGQAADGSILRVVRVDGDWYEVEFEGGTAFIASWLVVRGPDLVIETDEVYRNEEMGCFVAFDIQRGDTDMNIIIAGDRQNDIFVDLYRPNETSPLDVEGQLNKNFTDTGEPYIHQYYNWGLYWPRGIYQLEIRLDDESVMLAWELEEDGEYNIFVVCD
jgi:hypothetical protein